MEEITVWLGQLQMTLEEDERGSFHRGMEQIARRSPISALAPSLIDNRPRGTSPALNAPGEAGIGRADIASNLSSLESRISNLESLRRLFLDEQQQQQLPNPHRAENVNFPRENRE
jgi:hypothetical protein